MTINPDNSNDGGQIELRNIEVVAVFFGSGNDFAGGGAEQNYVKGGEGDDQLSGGDGLDILYGEDGDDKLDADTGADWLDGGDGFDKATFDMSDYSGAITFIASAAATEEGFTFANGAHVKNCERFDITTGSGDDRLWLGDYSDRVDTGSGDDEITTDGRGDDDVDGGSGTDRLIADFSWATSRVTTSSSGLSFSVVGSDDGVSHSGIEHVVVTGGSGDDLLRGLYGDDILTGNSGDDTLVGNDGDDILTGGSGDDSLYLGDGDDWADGGTGIDLASFNRTSLGSIYFDGFAAATSAGVTLSDGTHIRNVESLDLTFGSGDDTVVMKVTGTNTIALSSGDDLLVIDQSGDASSLYAYSGLMGSIPSYLLSVGGLYDAASDRVWARDIERVRIFAGSGDDDLSGLNGSDELRGNAGNDLLNGMAGDDLLYGGSGDDVIVGGAGRDLFYGEGGADRFMLQAAGESSVADYDVWYDFTTGEDTLDVAALYSGSLKLSITSSNGFSYLHIDTDGDGNDDALIAVQGSLSAADVVTAPDGFPPLGITVFGSAVEDVLAGGDGGDTLIGYDADDVLRGAAGDDILYGGPGSDVIDGGTGFDTVSYIDAGAGVTVNLGVAVFQNTGAGGSDKLDAIEGVAGSIHGDVLTGSDASNTLYGDAGDDRLNGGGAADNTVGGLGNDWHYVDDPGDTVVDAVGEGTADRVFASVSYALAAGAEIETLSTTLQTGTAAIDLTGNEFGQAVVGNNGSNRLDGMGGDDSVHGHGGDDTLVGGAGADLLDGGIGFDTADYSGAASGVTVNLLLQSATGGAGTDVVRDIERVVGSARNDILRGNGVANTLVGGDGDDRLDGFQGADATYGGLGNDWHYVDNAADMVVEAAGEGTLDRVFASASYVLAAGVEIELLSTTLQAGSAAIDLTGNELGQGMAGNNGLNRLDGGAGDDSLYGHNGDDVLIGGLGADLLDGGLGFDTADYSGAASAVSVNLLLQWATGGAGADTIKDVERVIGTGFHDVLRGSSAANTLEGGAGDDRLDGFQGVDTTLGGLGDDWHYVDHAGDTVVELAGQGFDRVLASSTYALAADADIELVSTTLQGGTAAIDLTGNGLAQSMAGNNGANRIEGLGGHDTLFGHGGSDTLVGGAGDDTLWGGAAADVFLYDAAGSGHDLIRDFADGADLIRFEAASGVDDFGDLAVGANGSGWAVITLPDGSTITLFGVAAASVDAADFVFGGA